MDVKKLTASGCALTSKLSSLKLMLVFEFLRRELKLNELKNVASASEALFHQQVAKAADSLFFKPGVA